MPLIAFDFSGGGTPSAPASVAKTPTNPATRAPVPRGTTRFHLTAMNPTTPAPSFQGVGRRDVAREVSRPTEEFMRTMKDPNAGGGRRIAIAGRIADMDRGLEIEIPGGGQIEEHAGLRLAAPTSSSGLVRAEPPVGEGGAKAPVEPPEALDHLGLRDLTAADPGLVAHDEAALELQTHIGQPLGDMGHEDGMTLAVEDGTVFTSEDERPSPVEKEAPAAHGRTVARD